MLLQLWYGHSKSHLFIFVPVWVQQPQVAVMILEANTVVIFNFLLAHHVISVHGCSMKKRRHENQD